MIPAIKSVIAHGILYFAMIVFVLVSGLTLFVSPLTAMVFAECAHVCRGIYDYYFFHDGKRNDVKRFLRIAMPGAIAIFIIYIVGKIATDSNSRDLLSFAAQIGAMVFAFLIVIPTFKDIYKNNDKSILKNHKCFSGQDALDKLFRISSRGLIIVGFLLIIFVKSSEPFYYEILVIIGCIVWGCRTALMLYCWRTSVIKRDAEFKAGNNAEYTAGDNDEFMYEPETTTYNERTINEREIKEIVQKIANKWSYRQDTLMSIGRPGRVEYKVTVEVSAYIELIINYTINGKVSSIDEGQLNSAMRSAEYKMRNKVAFEISEETKRELAKCNLPFSSYEVNTHIGNIEYNP